MHSEQPLQPEDSVKIISDALRQARQENTGAAFFYILWGALLCLHFLLRYLRLEIPALDNGIVRNCIWAVFPIGGIISYFKNKKNDEREQVIPLYEKVYLFSFGGYALAFFILFFAGMWQPVPLYLICFPLLLGLAVLTAGGITKHKVSIAGGVIAILLTGISINASLEIQNLIAGLGALIACVIPGISMKIKKHA